MKKIPCYVRSHRASEFGDSWLATKYKCGGEGYDRLALLLIAEDGEQLPEVWTRKEVQQLLFDLYSAAMDGPYLPNSKAMERVALQNKFTL